jgi:hypothetical protein
MQAVLDDTRNYLISLYPDLYTESTEYITFFDGQRVYFQQPGSRIALTGFTNPATRFFLTAFDDPGQVIYQYFDTYRVAQVPIYAKGDELAHIIWRIKQLTGTPRVILVVHSLGGLAIRAYVEQLANPTGGTHSDPYLNDIAAIITLDTPHGGAPIADWRSLPLGPCFLKPSADKSEMDPLSSDSIIPQINYYTSAPGATPLPEALSISSIVSFWSNTFPSMFRTQNTDNILDNSSQDLLGALIDPAHNSHSTLRSSTNSYNGPFWNGCGTVRPLHGVDCVGTTAQTEAILHSQVQPAAVMNPTVSITPSTFTLHTLTSQTLTALTPSGNSPVWSLLEGSQAGTITSQGLYQAPNNTGRYHVVAVDSGNPNAFGLATVTITILGNGFANTLSASNVTSNSAVLNGDANLASIPGYVNFLISTDPNMNGAVITSNQYLPVNSRIQLFSQALNGLHSNTNYYFQAALYGTDGTVRSTGNISSFRSEAQPLWPMSGHDRRRSGLSQFAGPQSFSGPPTWTVATSQPVIGDLAVSAEGNIYFASDALYALKPDGTRYTAPALLSGIATSPAIEDVGGYVYIAVHASDGGFDILRYTKQLTNGTTVFHVPPNYYGGGISELILGPNGTIYFLTGRYPGTLYSVGTSNWSNSICPSETGTGPVPNGPVLGADGSVYAMCQGVESGASGLYKLDPATGIVLAYYGYSRGATEPMIDSSGRIYAGYQAFGGAQYVGSYDLWDSNLNHLRGNSGDYTTSRASVFLDGSSTVRLGYADANVVYLVAEGAHPWQIISDGSTVPFFTAVPTVDVSGTIFVGNTTGMEAISQIDGSIIWSVTTGDGITTQPVVAGSGTLYVGSSSGKVYAFIH